MDLASLKSDLAKAIESNIGLTDKFDLIGSAAQKHIGWYSILIREVDPATSTLKSVYKDGPEHIFAYLSPVQPIAGTMAAVVIESGKPLFHDGGRRSTAPQSEVFIQHLLDRGVDSVFFGPVIHDGEVMIVGMLGSGLLPLVSGAEEYAKIFPWYYFDGGRPVLNGINWGHMAVLVSASVVLFGLALVGVNRRDLRAQSIGLTIVDRLRTNPLTQKLFERVAGTAKVSHIWVKTASEYQVLLIAASYYMFLMGGIAIALIYTAIDDSLLTLAEQLPDTLMALAGGGDISTPEGYYTIENFGLMAPIIFLMVTVTIGSRALAGEESKRTMGLLLANPISRRRVVIEKMVAMVVLTGLLGVLTFVGTLIGSGLAGLGMDVGNIAAISLMATLLGLTFGSLALALSAATGQVKKAVFGTVGPALIFYLLDAFLPLSDRLAGYAKWSVFYYYSGNDPLVNGLHIGHAALLAGLSAGLVVAAVMLFNRRDLRQG